MLPLQALNHTASSLRLLGNGNRSSSFRHSFIGIPPLPALAFPLALFLFFVIAASVVPGIMLMRLALALPSHSRLCIIASRV